MKIRSLFSLTIIAALLGMFIACDDLLKDLNSPGTDPDISGQYTVSFEANGGSPVPQSQTISKGGKVTEPAYMSKDGYGFGGWYKEKDFTDLWDFNNDTVTEDITLYAKWDSNYYTVNFEANGGNPVPKQQNIANGGKIIKPQDMTKEGFIFEGWYKEAAFDNLWNFNSGTVTGNIVLYAKWGYLLPPTVVQGTTLAQKLQWLNSNAASNNTYILEVNSDEFLGPNTLSYSGKENITIQLIGIGSTRVIDIYGYGSFFTIEDGVTLILDENISLAGRYNNIASLVQVNFGGNLILNQGAKISNNDINDYYYGGGVSVFSGTFTMNGGEISGNTASSGGGVYVEYGTFTMNGGEISGNTASGGGGVYVGYGTTFTMNGGKISGNTASGGGGVSVGYATFTMNGGEISGNTASGYGGGVSVYRSIEKTGGIITGYSSDAVNGNVVKDNNGNILNNRGHAVHVAHNDSRFIRLKETTAGQGDNLIYISNEPNPPTISGAWDE
jgi:uncharacterized repeat protein (TIGR02543 family)